MSTVETPRVAPRRVAVVPHTHWDREWYEPFQTFRLNLVRLVDGLLDQMEQDSSYRHFLLDGQLAAIDDYLEIRPENEGRLAALTGTGRITVGPWYILMDEFLTSGETIVRNLQAGLRRATSFGGAMEVGYLPDMFGHVAQMPQILAEAGFEHAVVWRGVPSTIDRNAFRWEAPDGSSVRAEYLVAGYGNGAALPDDAKALVRRLQAHIDEFGAFIGPEDPLLLMNGSDHLRPQPWLGRVVAEANEAQVEFDLTVSSLPAYLRSAPTEGLPEWRGELRSGFRSNLLMGVGSNRVDVKQAAARAERALERLAEPLSALFLPSGAWPETFVELAWTLMLRNAAHDSICACSVDDVVDAVLHRYAEARHIGQGLADEAVASVGRSMAEPGPVVVNPSAQERGGLVEVVVPAVGEVDADVQVLAERLGMPGSITLDGKTVLTMLGLIQGARIGDDMYITDVSLAEDETGLDITLVIGTEARDGIPVEEVKRELYTKLTARPETEVRLTLDQPPVRRILARQADVPGFGWSRFSAGRLAHPVGVAGGDGSGPVTLANGLVTVVVDADDGTFCLNGIPGYGRLVDGGDYGDTYNYSPPTVDSVVDTPDSVSVTIDERGPVRAVATITATYTWPDRVDEASKSRVGSHRVPVVTTLELRADEGIVRVETRFVNPSRDHRLRVHLPLPEPAAISRAECAFTVVERGLEAEGRARRDRHPHLPLAPVRLQRRAHRRPRGAAGVRAGRHRRRIRRQPGLHPGPDPATGHRHAVAPRHVPPPAASRAHDGHRGTPASRTDRGALCLVRGEGRPLPDGHRCPRSPTHRGVVRRRPSGRPRLDPQRPWCPGLLRPTVGRTGRGAGVQSHAHADIGGDRRAVRVAGRPTGTSHHPVRRELRAAVPGHRHRPSRRGVSRTHWQGRPCQWRRDHPGRGWPLR